METAHRGFYSSMEIAHPLIEGCPSIHLIKELTNDGYDHPWNRESEGK